MLEKSLKCLRIDKEFKNLARPLLSREYSQLEASLLINGCKDPLITWNDIIIDGYNRYEICMRHRIPFSVKTMDFSCREAAIVWICSTQLHRQNLTEETVKFLIGTQYEYEKALRTKYIFDPSAPSTSASAPQSRKRTNQKIAEDIAAENHLTPPLVMKYAVYASALHAIGSKEPLLIPLILSGRCVASHHNLMELSGMRPNEIKQFYQNLVLSLETTQDLSVKYRKVRQMPPPPNASDSASSSNIAVSSVKDMPVFDPDAEVTGLTLTIPSWISSIERVRVRSNLNIISDQARTQLEETLLDLQNQVFETLYVVRRL